MDTPTLEADRLSLGRLEAEYIPRIAELVDDREVARNTESIPYPYSEEDARDFLENVRAAARE